MNTLIGAIRRLWKNESRRSRRYTLDPCLVAADRLEARTLLSGTNAAPTIVDINTLSEFVEFSIEDVDPSDEYSVFIDINNDGQFEMIGSGQAEGIFIDLLGEIPANSSMDVSIYVTENYVIDGEAEGGSGTNTSPVVTVSVPGRTVAATPFVRAELIGNIVDVEVDTTNATGETVSVIVREAGQEEWIVVGDVTDQVFVVLDGADGQKDFEIATRTSYGSVSVDSEILVFNDVSAGEEPPVEDDVAQDLGIEWYATDEYVVFWYYAGDSMIEWFVTVDSLAQQFSTDGSADVDSLVAAYLHEWYTTQEFSNDDLQNNTEPEFAASEYYFNLPIDSIDGTTLGTVLATDADGQTVSYSTDDWMFSADADGNLILDYGYDLQYYGVGNSYSFMVTASDGLEQSWVYVTVNITESEALQNNTEPEFAASEYYFNLPIDSIDGTTLGTVLATDADGQTVSYSTDDWMFSADADGNLILDYGYDLQYYGVGNSYSFMVTASDGLEQSWAYVTVNITESEALQNNTEPEFAASEYYFNLPIDSIDGTTLGTVLATDADGQTVSYSTDDWKFSADADGNLILDYGYDLQYYGVGNSYSFMVTASDGLEQSWAYVTVNITESEALQNNTEPEFAASEYYFNLPIDSIDGTTLGTVLATDADGQTVSYSTDDWMFSADADGNLILDYGYDLQYYGVGNSYSFMVTASDGLEQSWAYVTVNITESEALQNNTEPEFAASEYYFNLPIDSIDGTTLGTVLATDADGQTVSYSTDDWMFSADADGNLILDYGYDLQYYGVGNSYSFMVTASDGLEQSWAYVTVNITESEALQSNTEPEFAASEYYFNLPIDSIDGTTLGTVLATDADGQTISYSTDDWMFSADSDGNLILDYGYDLQYYGVGNSYSFMVTASDGLEQSWAYVTVNITESEALLNNTEPEFAASEYYFNLPIDSIDGTTLGTVLATDADGQTVSYSTDDWMFSADADGNLILDYGYDLQYYGVGNSYSFMVTASDGLEQSWAYVTVNITESVGDDCQSDFVDS